MDGAAHRFGKVAHDRQAEPRPNRPVLSVTPPEVEALEGMVEVVRVETGAVVDDIDPAGRRENANRPSRGSAAKRVLDEVRYGLQHAVGVSAGRRLRS